MYIFSNSYSHLFNIFINSFNDNVQFDNRFKPGKDSITISIFLIENIFLKECLE